ncbi:MAG TPA: TPM domain-containing protein [Spirochaetota bacterium]|nr:TPM domain-containing protein [Spirochaetota bacterium]
MNRNAKDFFSKSESKAIEETIYAAESKTSGEVVLMITDESALYREAAMLGAVVFGVLSALTAEMLVRALMLHGTFWADGASGFMPQLLTASATQVSVWTFIPLLSLFYYVWKYLLLKLPGLKLLFVSKARLGEAVREGAVRAFYEKGLYRTRDETGILIYISLREHRVWILGDRGINDKIPAHFWEELSAELATGIREGRTGGAVTSVIEKCGAELARHFPRKSDDTNEMDNRVIY